MMPSTAKTGTTRRLPTPTSGGRKTTAELKRTGAGAHLTMQSMEGTTMRTGGHRKGMGGMGLRGPTVATTMSGGRRSTVSGMTAATAGMGRTGTTNGMRLTTRSRGTSTAGTGNGVMSLGGTCAGMRCMTTTGRMQGGRSRQGGRWSRGRLRGRAMQPTCTPRGAINSEWGAGGAFSTEDFHLHTVQEAAVWVWGHMGLKLLAGCFVVHGALKRKKQERL